MKIGHLNVRSLFTGFDELKRIIIEKEFDIIFLSETWLSEDDSSRPFEIPNYNFFRKDRVGRGGGVAVYIKHNYNVDMMELDFDINAKLECIVFKIKIKNRTYAFLVFYRPPSLNFNSIIPDFDNIFSWLYPTADEIFCLGDFNVNLLNLHNPLCSLFENYNLVQIIDQPTRISRTASTLLDAIFVTNTELICDHGVISADNISDHKITYCNINLIKIPAIHKIIKYRCFKNFNLNDFLTDMYSLPWNNILYNDDISNKINIFNDLILQLFNQHAPIKEARITKPCAPWLTSNIKIFMKQRDTALRKFKRKKDPNDWSNYKFLRNFTLSMIRKEKKKYLDTICGENNIKKTWSTIKNFNITSGKKNQTIPNNLSDPNDLNNFFATFIQNVSNCNERISFYENNLYNKDLKFSFKLSTISEVNKALNSIKTNATGLDEISPLMLKYCSPYIDKYITHIINCSIEINYFPDEWKVSIGKPLPKVSNPTTYNDIRLISILPAISKIYEKILYNQMYEFFISNNIVPITQCGFKKKSGTQVALTNVLDDIIRAYDKKMNTILSLLDFSKAFDTINHQLLVSKLKYYGFSVASFSLLSSYLHNRKQIIFSNNSFSDQAQILSGVPQGSILGPLLFLVYTSDILNSLTYCKIQAFADDTQIYYCFDDENYLEAEQNINQDLSMLSELSKGHNLKLNPTKSSLLLFGNKNKINTIKDSLNISIDGTRLNFVNSAKNLGIYLDIDLRFKDHLKSIFQKAYTALKMLYSNRHILSRKLRKHLCESLVLSNFTYCDFVYGFCLDNESNNRIQKVQNQCVRFVYGLRKYDHISHFYREIGWLRMEARRGLHFCTFLLKTINDTDSPASIRERLVFRREIHDRNVRAREHLTMPHHRSAMFQRSFSYNAVKYFNSLPINLLNLNINTFKIKYKKELLNLQNL